METTDYQNNLMQHTFGLSNGENRNWFGTSEGSKDCIEFNKLVAMGFAIKKPAPEIWGDDFVFYLTELGIQKAKETMPKPTKLTRSQKRYRRFLEFGDGFDSFIQFCYWDAKQVRRLNQNQ